MSTYFDTYRVKREAKYQDLMLKLQSRNGGIFGGYHKLLMASAIVGYMNEAFVPIEKNAEPVQLSFFSDRDREVMDLMAYAYTKSQSIVDKEEKYHIFESYANGGFPIFIEKLGIDEETVFDQKTKERVLKRYYSLLVRKNGFKKI